MYIFFNITPYIHKNYVKRKFRWARDALAQQMTHRASTQDQYYILQQKKRDSATVVKLIEKVMTHDEVHTVVSYCTRI